MVRWLCTSSVAALCAASAVWAAGPDPSPGRPVDLKSGEAGLWMQADRLEKDVQTSPLLVRDAELNAYIRSIVCRLAGQGCSNFRAYVLEVPAMNAYMLPNGAMVVWTGLLLRMHNEAQLAFVLGHEITHYARRHSLNRFESTRDTFNTLAFTQLAGLFSLPVVLAAGGALMSYTRDQEREADDGGFTTATEAGYDPAEAASVWRQAAAEDKADPHRPGGGIFGHDHPSSTERLEALAKRGKDLRSAQASWLVGGDAYKARTVPFRRQWLADEIARGNAWESVAVLEHLLEDDPQSGDVSYFLGEAYRKRGQSGDEQRAEAAYDRAANSDIAPPALWRDQGILAMRNGDKSSALTNFETYLAKAPAADDHAMIEFYLGQLRTK